MSGMLETQRRFYDLVNRVVEPVYRFSGILAGLTFVAALLTLPWYAETGGAVDLPVYTPGGMLAVISFWVSASLFTLFVIVETVTGVVAHTTAFGRWVLDVVSEE